MNYESIIMTGTSGSGKSAIVREICGLDSRFRRVTPVTTRAKRPDDDQGAYHYVTSIVFEQLSSTRELLVEATYRGESYGIKLVDFDDARRCGSIPILVLTPDSANRLDTSGTTGQPGAQDNIRYLTIFIDAGDDILDARLAQRLAKQDQSSNQRQRAIDREHKDDCLYSMHNLDLGSSVELILALWQYAPSGGVLPDRLIRLALKCGMLLREANLDNISGASYDLSLGDNYFYGGEIRVLDDRHPFLLIQPYDYAIVTSNEVACMPKDICGRFDLSVSLFCQGVILSNGPQVDPGFIGSLFCLLFNTSSSPVLLKRRQHYATLEFHKLIEPTYSYSGRYQAKTLLDYLPSNAARGAINELKKELDEVRRESRQLENRMWMILSLILVLLAVLIAFG